MNDIFDATTNVTGRYILIETNALFVAKVDKIDIIYAYSYAETDSKLDGKVDKSELIDAYTSSEDDALLQLKVEKIDLMNWANLTYAQSIFGKSNLDLLIFQAYQK